MKPYHLTRTRPRGTGAGLWQWEPPAPPDCQKSTDCADTCWGRSSWEQPATPVQTCFSYNLGWRTKLIKTLVYYLVNAKIKLRSQPSTHWKELLWGKQGDKEILVRNPIKKPPQNGKKACSIPAIFMTRGSQKVGRRTEVVVAKNADKDEMAMRWSALPFGGRSGRGQSLRPSAAGVIWLNQSVNWPIPVT